jgi:hypothetical protein
MNFKVVLRGIRPCGTQKKISDRGLFKHGSYSVYALGSLVNTCRRFSKSVSLNRMASCKNIFVWFWGVLICQRGLIPRRRKPCGVSDPAEQDPAGYQTPQNYVLQGIKPHRTMADLCTFYSIQYTCSAGSDTPQNNVLRGLIPRLTKSCGVSDPAEQSPAGYQTPRNNIQKRIFLRIRKRIQKRFRV